MSKRDRVRGEGRGGERSEKGSERGGGKFEGKQRRSRWKRNAMKNVCPHLGAKNKPLRKILT